MHFSANEPCSWQLDIVDRDMVEYVKIEPPEEISHLISYDDLTWTVLFNGSASSANLENTSFQIKIRLFTILETESDYELVISFKSLQND